MFAGVQSGLASWWEVTARIRTLQEDYLGAAAAYGIAVNFRRIVSQAPQLEGPYKFNSLAIALHRHALALLAANDVAGATQAFKESRSIRERIGLPPIASS